MSQNNNFLPIDKWFNNEFSRPLIICGPCSAESESQLLQTAELLANDDRIKVFRAGIWKPRTRPDSFEGVGKKGLKWLQKVKKEFNLRTIVEVANKEHVKLCLEYETDMIWIGARTTSNPFSVQEIADELKGINIPVFISNFFLVAFAISNTVKFGYEFFSNGAPKK